MNGWYNSSVTRPEIGQVVTVGNPNWNYIYNDVMFMVIEEGEELVPRFILKEQTNTGGIAAYYQKGNKYLGFEVKPTRWKPQPELPKKAVVMTYNRHDEWASPKKVNTYPHFVPPSEYDDFIPLSKSVVKKKKGRSKFKNKEPVQSRRKRIFERDSNLCVRCGSPENLTLDHIKPKSKGGTNEESNLQTMCRRCNVEKGDIYPYEF